MKEGKITSKCTFWPQKSIVSVESSRVTNWSGMLSDKKLRIVPLVAVPFLTTFEQVDTDFLFNWIPCSVSWGHTKGLAFALQLTVLFVVLQEVVLGDLKADTSYSVSVGAYTAKGDGARSKPVSVCSALPRKCVYIDSYTNIQKDISTHTTSNDLWD